MPDVNVTGYIDQLRQALPHVPPVPEQKLRALHRERDYEGMVRLIRSTMNVDVRLRIGWVNSGGPNNAPAWIQLPVEMPGYGTAAFKELTLDLFIRKSFLETSTYQRAAIVIAHELSHVVLESIRHPLRKEEKAVDLTAMLLGFSRLYQAGSHTVERLDANNTLLRKTGYLSEDEIKATSRLLLPANIRARQTIIKFLTAVWPLLAIGGIWVFVWFAVEANRIWNAHAIVVAEQERLAKRLPIPQSERTTLTEVHAGITSLTQIFIVDTPAKKFNFDAFEKALRKNTCGLELANIRKGVSYWYEYRRPSGERIAIFEIASCLDSGARSPWN
jgi:hypothetical protein